MERITVATLDQVVDLIRRLLDKEPGINYEQIGLSDDLTTITIEIKGDRYHGTVSGDLAHGLWDLQQEVYRALAYTLTGVDDKRRLGKIPEDWKLQFEVRDGSTILTASVKWVINALKEGYLAMDDNHKTIVILGVALVITSGVGLTYVANNYIDAHERIEMEQERTNQFEVIARAARAVPDFSRWREAARNGAKSVAKSVPDADSLRIGEEQLGAHQIREINARAVREAPTTEPIIEPFRVVGFKRQDDGVSKFTIIGADSELTVVLDAESFTNEQLDLLWSAAQHNARVSLEVQIKRVGDVVKGAWVTDILAPEVPDNKNP
ncbi:hypothetical protein ABRZ00_12895 [Castellaniella ginsengisoli]|uniref:Uncharacterized protein n=1 Tax=Castellaniella ginsengisoli TaxID=546114 RepID=A0AB39DMU0_9BURK